MHCQGHSPYPLRAVLFCRPANPLLRPFPTRSQKPKHYPLHHPHTEPLGLISPAPGRKNAQLQSASKQVEAMVLAKMAQREVGGAGTASIFCRQGRGLLCCARVRGGARASGRQLSNPPLRSARASSTTPHLIWVRPHSNLPPHKTSPPPPAPQYIILCLEDTSDWGNATTRRTVMQARRARGAARLGAECPLRGQAGSAAPPMSRPASALGAAAPLQPASRTNNAWPLHAALSCDHAHR